MIVELKTTTVKPRRLPEYEAEFARLYASSGLSCVRGVWRTMFGPLNQSIELSAYTSHDERVARNEMLASLEGSPTRYELLADAVETQLLVPASFSPALEPSVIGNVYEMRTYSFTPGSMQDVMRAWEAAAAWRMALSPLVMAGRTDVGPLNQLVHIWAYKDLDERESVRQAARGQGQWPPKTSPIRQESLILQPTSFSLLR